MSQKVGLEVVWVEGTNFLGEKPRPNLKIKLLTIDDFCTHAVAWVEFSCLGRVSKILETETDISK